MHPAVAALSVRTTPQGLFVLDQASNDWRLLERGDSFEVAASEESPAWYIRRVTNDARFKVQVWVESKKGKIRRWGGRWLQTFFVVFPRRVAQFVIGPWRDPRKDPAQRALLQTERKFTPTLRADGRRQERHRARVRLASIYRRR